MTNINIRRKKTFLYLKLKNEDVDCLLVSPRFFSSCVRVCRSFPRFFSFEKKSNRCFKRRKVSSRLSCHRRASFTLLQSRILQHVHYIYCLKLNIGCNLWNSVFPRIVTIVLHPFLYYYCYFPSTEKRVSLKILLHNCFAQECAHRTFPP